MTPIILDPAPGPPAPVPVPYPVPLAPVSTVFTTTQLPHFAYPFTFTLAVTGSGAGTVIQANVVEQDAVEEVAACVINTAVCPQGFRDDWPEFGLPDPTFSSLPLDTTVIEDALRDIEPRAFLTLTDGGDPFSAAIRTLGIGVGAVPGGLLPAIALT